MKVFLLLTSLILTSCAGTRDYTQVTLQEPWDGVSTIQVEDRLCAVVVIDEMYPAMQCWKSEPAE